MEKRSPRGIAISLIIFLITEVKKMHIIVMMAIIIIGHQIHLIRVSLFDVISIYRLNKP